MAPSILLISVPHDTKTPQARLPTIPYLLRIDADEADIAELAGRMLYRQDPGGTYDPFSTGRFECAIKGSDGRVQGVRFRNDRPDPMPTYDEFLGFFKSLALCALGFDADDGRKLGLLACADALLALWQSDESRLRAGLTPPFTQPFL